MKNNIYKLSFEGLVRNMEYAELRDNIKQMSINNLIKLSKCIHGATYRLLEGD